MKYVFILNTFSSKDTRDIRDDIAITCLNMNMDYIIERNSDNLSTNKILKKYQDKEYIIFAVGGDGLINKVVNGIVNTNNILGYIPYGTINNFHKTVANTLKKPIEKIDVVQINDKYFINTACFGIDANIINNANDKKITSSSKKYDMNVLLNILKYQPQYFKIAIDKNIISGNFTSITMCNGKYYQNGYNIAPEASLNDGFLDVYFVDKLNKFELASLMLKAKYGYHEDIANVKKILTNCITLFSDKEIKANIDGEEITSDMFDIKLHHNKLKLYQNQEFINKVLTRRKFNQ